MTDSSRIRSRSNFTILDEAHSILHRQAAEMNLSASRLIENILLGIIPSPFFPSTSKVSVVPSSENTESESVTSNV